MYPLNTVVPWAREQWYVIGLSQEFDQSLKSRKVLDEPIVFFRTEQGEPKALWGLCPHRLMPLERGTLRGDRLVCGYHGFEFGMDGNCVSIPTADVIPARCRVKAYELVERGPFVWIWMGEGAADHARLPDASDIGLGDDPGGWRFDAGDVQHLRARAQLLIDNLLDLSHLAFVHTNTVPGETIPLAEAQIEDSGTRLRVTRTVPEGDGGPFFRFLAPDAPARVSTQMITDVYSPGLINAGGPWAWESTGDGSLGKSICKLNFIHVITPETPHSTHYFGGVSRDFRLADDQLSMQLVHQSNAVRSEDIAALEAIESVASQYGDLGREISVAPDAGALRVRRKIAAMIAAEQAGGAGGA